MPEPLISVTGLSHAFGDGATKKTVLDGVSVNFYPGEIVIVMGPSGAGKTTLLSLVGALRSVQTAMPRRASCGRCADASVLSFRTTTWWRP
jgi:ABC-type lipoprotein export system ATPase subunit